MDVRYYQRYLKFQIGMFAIHYLQHAQLGEVRIPQKSCSAQKDNLAPKLPHGYSSEGTK